MSETYLKSDHFIGGGPVSQGGGLKFYCLYRANALTEDVAELLSKAGSVSMSMSIEAGREKLRNDVLKRNMSDEMMRKILCRGAKNTICTPMRTRSSAYRAPTSRTISKRISSPKA